jgi:hypothetical protein
MTFWVTLDKPVAYRKRTITALCVDGTEEQARQQVTDAFADRTVVSMQPLPYPAEPRLVGPLSTCPAFCYQPQSCAGRTSCPRSIACSE